MALAIPGADGFERTEPAAVGLDAAALESAVDRALAHESPVARDFSDHRERLAVEEGDRGAIVGPLPDWEDDRGVQDGFLARLLAAIEA